jgi:hypothetical protein
MDNVGNRFGLIEWLCAYVFYHWLARGTEEKRSSASLTGTTTKIRKRNIPNKKTKVKGKTSSSVPLSNFVFQLVPDISWQAIGPVFKGQVIHNYFWTALPLKKEPIEFLQT